MSVVVTFVGPRDVLEKLSSANDAPDIEFDEVQPEGSMADAVDSPIGPEEVQQFFALLTVGIGTASAAVSLLQKIKALLKNSGRGGQVKVKNPKTNKLLAEVDENTDVPGIVPRVFK